MFDIGSSLREARLRQELDFPELEERTKIRPKYLRALEDERFDILPAPTYVRGFLRSYARGARPGRTAVRRRVQLAFHDRRGRCAAARAQRSAATTRSRPARVAHRGRGARRDRNRDRARHRGMEVRRAGGRKGARSPIRTCGLEWRAYRMRRAPHGSSFAPPTAARGWRYGRCPPTGSSSISGTLEQGQRKSFEGKRLQLALAEPRERRRAAERKPGRASQRYDLRRDLAEDHSGNVLSRPRAAIVVTGSELVRGEREDRNGPFLASEVVRLGLEPASIRIVGDGVDELEHAFREGFDGRSLPRVGRSRTDTRRPHGRARRARRRASARPRPGARDGDRGRLADVRRAARAPVLGLRGRSAQAGDPTGGRGLARAGRYRSGARPGPGRVRRRRAPRASARAPATVAAGARERTAVRRVLERAPARTHRVLRFFGTPESAVAEALRAAGGEGDGRRRHDLRARVRDPRRPLRRARRARRAEVVAESLRSERRRRISSARTSARSPRSSSTSAGRVT